VTEQPPGQQPPDEQDSNAPATGGADDPTRVGPPEPPAAFAPATPPGPSAEAPAPVPPPVTGAPPAQAPPIPGPGPAAAHVNDGPLPSGSPFPADRPEIAVGAAFAGGFVLALILKRLAR
jgi:hypothetical protein